jgi:two-component system, NtrC family, response regulator AtoC
MPQTASRLLNVLVVDDEPDVRDLLVEYFRDNGHTVTPVSDGHAAVAEIAQNASRYSLIVSDLQLPGVDGLGVLKAARAANPSAVVIIVTGYASLDSAVQAVRLGAYDYLTKPFSLGQIEVIVQRVSERQALEAENRHLARKVGNREVAEPRGIAVDRLDAIDARLARIEELLGRILGARPRL